MNKKLIVLFFLILTGYMSQYIYHQIHNLSKKISLYNQMNDYRIKYINHKLSTEYNKEIKKIYKKHNWMDYPKLEISILPKDNQYNFMMGSSFVSQNKIIINIQENEIVDLNHLLFIIGHEIAHLKWLSVSTKIYNFKQESLCDLISYKLTGIIPKVGYMGSNYKETTHYPNEQNRINFVKKYKQSIINFQ